MIQIRQLPLFLACLLAGCVMASAPWVHAEEGAVGWNANFSPGTPQAPVPGWEVEYDVYKNVTYTALYFSHQDGYAYVSMQARDGYEGKGVVKSPLISCNVDTYNILECWIADITGQTLTAWNVSLEIINQLENPTVLALLPSTNGASGLFYFSLQGLPSFSGEVNFRIRLDTKLSNPSSAKGWILIKSLRLLTPPPYHSGDYLNAGNQKQYEDFWYEDFSTNTPPDPVGRWWDGHDEEKLNSEILQLSKGARFRRLIPGSIGHLLSPGLYWDMATYPLIRGRITGLSPNTRFTVSVLEIGRNDNGEWQSRVLGQFDKTLEWVVDIRNVPNWIWSKKRMLAVELFIQPIYPEQDPGEMYADLGFVAISRERKPVPLSGQVQTYATPNPFFPLRGQTVTLQFELPDPTVDYTVRIFNLKGRLVRILKHCNVWDGNDDQGRLSEGGAYVYQVEKNGQRYSGQIILIQ